MQEMRDGKPAPGGTLRSVRSTAVRPCAVCDRELTEECFEPVPWRFSWSNGRGRWCRDCVATAERFKRAGQEFGLRELKAKIRTAVLGPGGV